MQQKIKALDALGKYILAGSEELERVIQTASAHNKWFTQDHVKYALEAIAENYLNEHQLHQWLSSYDLPATTEPRTPQRIAIIMAGNIPLAGFHDLLCVIISGSFALIKQSSKDQYLLPHLLDKLCAIEPVFKNTFEFAEQPLKNFDAVIATGSNNSSRYFEYYFGKYPHIIRKNRNSVAVLSGRETKEELLQLGKDIFLYFGLGCRSVSKLYVPRGFDFNAFLNALAPYETLMMHSGYKNNYDYQRTVLIMNKTPHYASRFLMLQENSALSSPIAMLSYEEYDSLDEVKNTMKSRSEQIQCIVLSAQCPLTMNNAAAFGESQHPRLWDYADGIDTLQFLGFQRKSEITLD
ncbi:MAG TPA: acyl-CoA reductase [Chitinophagales bacterium]|nr:acyl-CoA reductase [Chitinophagales bacterium]